MCHSFFFLLTSYPLTHTPIFNLSSSVIPTFPLFLPTNSLFSLTNPFTFPLNHFTLFPNATFSYTHHKRTLTFRLQTSFHASIVLIHHHSFITHDLMTRFAPKITTFIKMDREDHGEGGSWSFFFEEKNSTLREGRDTETIPRTPSPPYTHQPPFIFTQIHLRFYLHPMHKFILTTEIKSRI